MTLNLRRGLPAKELKEWQDRFVEFLKKLTLRSPKPLVLKSPTHTGRIPLLRELFPEARFIHIVRDPYAVFCSTLNLQRALCADNSLGRAEPADLEERVLSTYMNLYQAYHLYRPLISPGQLFELRFETSKRIRSANCGGCMPTSDLPASTISPSGCSRNWTGTGPTGRTSGR